MSSHLTEAYPAIAKELLSPVLKLLHIVHSHFGGDLEQFFILAVLAARSAEDPQFAEVDMAQLESGALDRLPNLGINLRSLSASTGIPLETVRRKVRLLRDKGWVGRDGNNLCYTPKAFVDMTPVREALLQQALSNHRLVQSAEAQLQRREKARSDQEKIP